VCRLTPATFARKLADRCPNLVGFKDGIGDIDADGEASARRWASVSRISAACPLPRFTHAAYKALGRAGMYSSALFQLHFRRLPAVLSEAVKGRRPRHAKQAFSTNFSCPTSRSAIAARAMR